MSLLGADTTHPSDSLVFTPVPGSARLLAILRPACHVLLFPQPFRTWRRCQNYQNQCSNPLTHGLNHCHLIQCGDLSARHIDQHCLDTTLPMTTPLQTPSRAKQTHPCLRPFEVLSGCIRRKLNIQLNVPQGKGEEPHGSEW